MPAATPCEFGEGAYEAWFSHMIAVVDGARNIVPAVLASTLANNLLRRLRCAHQFVVDIPV